MKSTDNLVDNSGSSTDVETSDNSQYDAAEEAELMAAAGMQQADGAASTDGQAASGGRKKEQAEPDDAAREANNKYLRLLAEFENYRKRIQRDLSEARQLSKIAAIEEILPIMDHFQMAMSAVNNSNDLSTLKEGMNMILAEFEKRFENLGITKVETVGRQFDPMEHEAVSTEPSIDVPEEHIVKEWKAGYRFGDHLIRPASVVVSSGPE